MKTFVHILLIAACFVACARSLPSRLTYDSTSDDDDEMIMDFGSGPFGGWDLLPSSLSDSLNKLRDNMFKFFWNMPDSNIPEGANTTSTTKVINGHVVTINETTYTSGNGNFGSAFRIRIVDVKPQNGTLEAMPEPPSASVRPEPENPESRETVEDFNNEISKNTETLTA